MLFFFYYSQEEIKTFSKHIPLIHAGNFSLGVNLMIKKVGEIAEALGDDFNIEIVEGHHDQKIDAPSGTAVAIAESLCNSTSRNIKEDLVYGREVLYI